MKLPDYQTNVYHKMCQPHFRPLPLRSIHSFQIPSYELIVQAKDNGSPAPLTGTATVLITVQDKNDNPPRFSRLFSVNVTENAEFGSFVIRITSTDLDTEPNTNVTYSFTENPGEKFLIDPQSGNVTVNGHLDREEEDEYLLRVSATDGAWTTETTLTITVQDENDNAPTFDRKVYHFHFPELQRRMQFVGRVVATDRDKSSNSVVSYGLAQPSDFFTIDPATGDIFCKRSLKYKHTHRTSSPENKYSLMVVAIDNGKPPMSSKVAVEISILDANNHAPVFEEKMYYTPVPEDYPVSQRVIRLEALDSDFGLNGEIEYSIVNGNGSSYFGVDSRSGEVFVRKDLGGLRSGSVFQVTARALDKGVPRQKDEIGVTFVLTGENLRTPAFVSYQTRVLENVLEGEPLNSTILSVSAVDAEVSFLGMKEKILV